MMRKGLSFVLVVLVAAVFPLAATTAEVFFSADSVGNPCVTNVQEGTEIWICVYDPNEDVDCDVRDKLSPDIKLWDPKTGASIVWHAAPATLSDPEIVAEGYDYLEEMGADTGWLVSSRPFRIGTRESSSSAEPWKGTHVVDVPTPVAGAIGWGLDRTATDATPRPLIFGAMPMSFKWGGFFFSDIHNETKGGANAEGDGQHGVGFVAGNSVAFGSGLIELSASAGILPSDLDGARTLVDRPVREHGHPDRDDPRPERSDGRRRGDDEDRRHGGDDPRARLERDGILRRAKPVLR